MQYLYKYWRSRIVISFLCGMLIISSCGQRPTPQHTEAGLLKKVVIRRDNTQLQSWENGPSGTTLQWTIFYLMGQTKEGKLLVTQNPHLDEPVIYALNEGDAFEWDTNLVLNFYNSPHLAKRQPVLYYRTAEEARNGQGDAVLREKKEHSTEFHERTSPTPILKEAGNNIYLVAALYDRITEDGEYQFFGDYDFVYVQYTANAHQFRRYVSKQELDRQIKALLTGQHEIAPGSQVTPNIADQYANTVINLFGDVATDVATGLGSLQKAFGEGSIPQAVGSQELDPNAIINKDSTTLNNNLYNLTNKMIGFAQNPDNFNQAGYAYIPAEWME